MIHRIIYAADDIGSKIADLHPGYAYFRNNLLFKNDDAVLNIIDKMVWSLRFNPCSKGTCYLRFAIYLAYMNQELLYDNKRLIEHLSVETGIKPKLIRNAIDNSISSMFRFSENETLQNLFEDNYDGRKPSTKYFIALCVNYLNQNTDSDKVLNMYHFI